MDKINEILTWLTLAFSWWLCKREYIGNNKIEPKKVELAVCVGYAEPRPLVHEKFQSGRLHGESIISSDLSDLMKKKSRLNKGRRVEDRQVAEQ